MARLRQIVPLLLSLTILLLAAWAIAHELKAYSLQAVVNGLIGISAGRKFKAVLLTILGYLSMTGYDWLGFIYSGYRLPLGQIMRTSFISYALGNTIGLTLVSGTAIRYRYYRKSGLSGMAIAKVIAFTHLAFWLGILSIGGIIFSLDPLKLPNLVNISLTNARPLGFVFLTIIVLYLCLIALDRHEISWKGEKLALPSVKLFLGLMVFSCLDWGLASGVLYNLLPENFPLTYPSFFAIYILALTAGVISTVPGGLGVFETVILFLRPESISAPEIIGSLVAYRGIYFFLPLIVATALILGYECQHRSN